MSDHARVKQDGGRLEAVENRTEYFPSLGRFARPQPESLRRRALIHTVALFTLAVSFGYLGWRLVDTINLNVWWVALPLFAAEAHNAFGLVLYTLALWNVDAGPPWRVVRSTNHRIAILIPTYNEPADVLLPAVAAALAVRLPHETWVLDDGKRPEIERLAHDLGANYVTRPDNSHAKAGNLNHAMAKIRADFYAIFDADHIARPEFLRHTLCYFEDPKVALVQTPQDFYNQDSFEHMPRGERDALGEEAVFYRVIAPGKNHWGGAFWCGTGAIVRADALDDVGGVATETITEDIHTTIKMNRKGWTAVYHNEVLAMGLAPTDATQYMLQRNRWAIGAMQTMRKESPLTSKGLTFGQRLSFATTLLAWFDAWRTLVFLLLPPLVIFTGASPIDAPGYVYAPLFLLTFFSQMGGLKLLARGYYAPMFALTFEMLRLPAVLPATLTVFTPDTPRKFTVTRKGAADHRQRMQPPILLSTLAVLCIMSLIWFGLTIAGLTFTSYDGVEPAVIGSALFAAGNLWILMHAVMRIRDSAFSGERRGSTRFDVFIRGDVDGQACIVRNISLTGARIQAGVHLQEGTDVTLNLERVQLRALVLPPLPNDTSGEVRLRYLPGQTRKIGDLVLAIMRIAYTSGGRQETRERGAPQPGQESPAA